MNTSCGRNLVIKLDNTPRSYIKLATRDGVAPSFVPKLPSGCLRLASSQGGRLWLRGEMDGCRLAMWRCHATARPIRTREEIRPCRINLSKFLPGCAAMEV
jgi:hypothetical protein